nr:unnamed protein product [Callosobruchus analis]
MVAFCFSSSLRYFSASLTMRSMSSLLRRPLSLVMVILFSLLVDFSTAVTFRMPLASMSNVTSIWGTPLGAGGMPVNSNLPSSHHASGSFDTQRQGGDVQQQQILHLFGLVSVQDGRLDCSSVRHGLVRVDGFVELLAVEEVLQQFLDLGDTSRAADQHDVVWLTIRLSKSSPPKWVSPAVDFTSKMPSSMVRMETSKVPPPRSKMSTLRSP